MPSLSGVTVFVMLEQYVIGAELLIAVLDKIDFSEEAAQDMVSASFPKDWMCQFKGLQTLVMKGLLNPTTMKSMYCYHLPLFASLEPVWQ